MKRRELLRTLGAAGTVSLAGCNTGGGTPTGTGRETTTLSPTETRTPSPTETPTPYDDQAPIIHEYSAEPQEAGTVLYVSLEGEDNREIEYAAIGYGDRILEERPDAKEISMDGRLEDIPDAEPAFPGLVSYVLRDVAGNETEKTAYADQEAPTLSVHTSTPEAAGELGLVLEGEDDVGLHELQAALGGEEILNMDATGRKQISSESTVTADEYGSVTPGEMNIVEAELEDAMGNTARKIVDQYVRKYDQMEDTRLDIGAVWISQQGGAFRQECRDSYEGTEPAVGIYDKDPIPQEVVSQHIDQMTGHGINRILYDHAGKLLEEGHGRTETFLNSPIIDHVTVEPFYTRMPLIRTMDRSWKDYTLPRDLPLIRDSFLDRDNVATIDGRPVVSTWNFIALAWGEEREKIMDEFGSYEAFVDDMRDHLRLNDGTNPFLILGKGSAPLVDHGTVRPLVTQFDGVQTWTPANKDQGLSWEDILNNVQQTYSDNAEFARNHEMEFTPTVIPGYNDLGSECDRAGDKHVPRSPERFQQMLNLAEQYATSGRINIATWNDWTEGTQIEPGTFNGNQFGTGFVEIVKKFQGGH